MLVSPQYRHGIPVTFRRQPARATVQPVTARAADGIDSQGLFWAPENWKGGPCLLAMHPQVDFTRHYAFPHLLDAGYACLGANTRYPNNDWATVHEQIILDVGAWVSLLKADPRVDKIVLLGNSGGGSLMGLYQSQAALDSPRRLSRTPGGKPLKLARTDMPEADAIIFLAAHRGEGNVLRDAIDPAVVDEGEPLSRNPELDMYDPRNGFREAPEWSRYSRDFIAEYRSAQADRVRRLDAMAREHIAENARAEELRGDPSFAGLPRDRRQDLLRSELFQPVMVVYRTMANLKYADRTIDPSPRPYGSLVSPRPDIMNYGLRGFARVTTPHAWLSTWSGESTNADLAKTGPGIRLPALVVQAEHDPEVYPESDARLIFDSLGSADKQMATVPGALHYFEPLGEDGGHLDAAMETIIDWLRSRFDS